MTAVFDKHPGKLINADNLYLFCVKVRTFYAFIACA